MYLKIKASKTELSINQSYIGERLEEKIERILSNKEPINDGAPIIYTERKDGVLPEYNPRTDRFEIAVDAMDKVDRDNKAKRENRHKPKEDAKKTSEHRVDKVEPSKDMSGGQPIQATDNK